MYLKSGTPTNKSSGWKALRLIQLTAVIESYRQKQISYKALRTYFSVAELIAKREAAARAKPIRCRSPRRNAAPLKELPVWSRRAARELARVDLITIKNELALVDCPADSALLEQAVGQGRSKERLVPVPREVLRYLTVCPRPSIALTMLSYCIRGLSIRSRTIKARGSVKASWICDTTGLSLRAIRAARAELIKLQWIARDVGSSQRKLNRTGAYFEINLSWSAAAHMENPIERVLRCAPPKLKKRTLSAPPIIRQDNSRNTSKADSGVSIWNVKKENLFHLGAVGELYNQAIARGLLRHSEANALNFLGCAVRARDLPNAPRIFMGLIKQALWRYVTQCQEDRARAALIRRRAEDPEFMAGGL